MLTTEGCPRRGSCAGCLWRRLFVALSEYGIPGNDESDKAGNSDSEKDVLIYFKRFHRVVLFGVEFFFQAIIYLLFMKARLVPVFS